MVSSIDDWDFLYGDVRLLFPQDLFSLLPNTTFSMPEYAVRHMCYADDARPVLDAFDEVCEYWVGFHFLEGFMRRRLWKVRVLASTVAVALACRADTFEPPVNTPTGIQPQFSVTASDPLYPIGDSWIRSAPKWQNHGTSDSLRTKTTITSTDTNRTTLQFDQAAIAAEVGSGTLVSATLELIVKASGWYTAGNDVAVHRLTTTWSESGVNWNCAIDPYPLNTYYDCPGATWAMSGAGTRPYVLTPTETKVKVAL